MNTTITPTTINTSDQQQARIVALRTPYHALGFDGTPLVPEWAQHRSVYRSAGRTKYLVETNRFHDASSDLATLSSSGWEVQVAHAGATSNITLTRAA